MIISIICVSDNWKWLAETLASPAATVLSVYLAYKFAIRQLKKDTSVQVDREKNKRMLGALEACWAMLAYITPTENKFSIITWIENKDKKTYYLNRENANAFLEKLASHFYTSAQGLYIPEKIRGNLFEYRSILYGLMLSTKNAETNPEITNENMITKMFRIHEELTVSLREELSLRSPSLPEGD